MSQLSSNLCLLGELCRSPKTTYSVASLGQAFLAWSQSESIDNFLHWKTGQACSPQWTLFSLRYELVLQDILSTMEKAQVRFAPIKGADLSFRIYPHSSIRSFGDIDLLIHEEDWDKAGEALKASGWDIKNWEICRRHHHVSAVCKKGIVLEPHWTLPGFDGVPVSEIWKYIHPQGEKQYRSVLSTELNLLMLCLHMSRQEFLVAPLGRFLLDVHFLLEKESLDLEKLRDLCTRWKVPYPGDLLGAFPEFFPSELLQAMPMDEIKVQEYRWIFEHRHEISVTQALETANGNPLKIHHWMSGLRYSSIRRKYNLPDNTSWCVLTYYQLADGWKKLCQLFRRLTTHKNATLKEYLKRVNRLTTEHR